MTGKKVQVHRNPGLGPIVPYLLPFMLAGAGYAASRIKWLDISREFFLGPGRLSRILLLVFCVLNFKNFPFVWTARIFYDFHSHLRFPRKTQNEPKHLFLPVVVNSRTPLTETDYNIHKSNSTYFSDLDIARTHFVCYVCRNGYHALRRNDVNKLVLDPSTGQPARGTLALALGSVHCSFHREIPPFVPYEMWTRLLSWDRKWLYMVTHFVPRGLGRPREFVEPGYGRQYTHRKSGADNTAKEGWEKKVYATAVSKYVLKIGRLTVHPAVYLQPGGYLPERPGGWMTDDLATVDQESLDAAKKAVAEQEAAGVTEEGEWTWQRVELRRQEGMMYAAQFGAMDELKDGFQGGTSPIIGVY